MKFSPLFWPIQVKGDTIYILDETKLPQQLSYIKATNYIQAARAIRDMKTRAVGQVLLVMYAFLVEAKKQRQKKNLLAHLEKVAGAINATRPTLSFKMLTEMALGWAKRGDDLEKNIPGFLESLKARRIQQARDAAGLINDGEVILTHCNLSGLIPLTAEFCRQQDKRLSFFVTETRPYLQGSRLTAWELKRGGFAVTIIADNTVAQVMAEGKIDKVIVGADHLAQNGDIANKIGTYQIAILAKYFSIPFYVVCPPASKARSGEDIAIEVRPDKELLQYKGVWLAPKDAKGYYPAFDITPDNLITEHIYLRL